jgi:hypothetical protein
MRLLTSKITRLPDSPELGLRTSTRRRGVAHRLLEIAQRGLAERIDDHENLQPYRMAATI